MSTPGGGGASRGITAKPTPPLKGSFPLDHFGECKHFMLAYAKCMKVRTALFPTECAAPAAGSPAPPPPAAAAAHAAHALPWQDSEGSSSQCREVSKKYLDCRMKK